MQQIYEKYIRRCIDLALNGKGNTRTNPMVGCVIVYDDRIIGEGYHEYFGGPHAEVNAIRAVKDPSLLTRCTLYVSLEPCSHTGKTPPCSDLIIEKKIPRVVIGSGDPNSLVAGRGIQKLRNAGIKVIEGVLHEECKAINHEFFTFHSKKRPYIILKWAQSADGFMDAIRPTGSPVGPYWISNSLSQRLVHKWRTEVDAILVGTNTVIADNPSLTARLWPGQSPLRVVPDRFGRLDSSYKIFSAETPTLVFTEEQKPDTAWVHYEQINFGEHALEQMLQCLWGIEVQSLLVEGGSKLLKSFIDQNLWDEARVFTGSRAFHDGLRAPVLQQECIENIQILNDQLTIFKPIATQAI